MKKPRKTLLVGVLGLLLCVSCYYDQEVEEVIPDIPIDEPISFQEDIQPLFVLAGRDCTTCHDGSIANPDLREGNAYDAIVPELVVAGDAASSAFFTGLPGNDHPIEAGFRLTVDEIALIRSWIDRGAEDN